MPILKCEGLDAGIKYAFENGSISVFDYERGTYSEILLNNTFHLDK